MAPIIRKLSLKLPINFTSFMQILNICYTNDYLFKPNCNYIYNLLQVNEKQEGMRMFSLLQQECTLTGANL